MKRDAYSIFRDFTTPLFRVNVILVRLFQVAEDKRKVELFQAAA